MNSNGKYHMHLHKKPISHNSVCGCSMHSFTLNSRHTCIYTCTSIFFFKSHTKFSLYMFYKLPKYFRMYDSISLYYSFGFHNPTMMSSLYSKCPGNSITKQNIWHHQLILSPYIKTNSCSHGAEVQVSVIIMTPPPKKNYDICGLWKKNQYSTSYIYEYNNLFSIKYISHWVR